MEKKEEGGRSLKHLTWWSSTAINKSNIPTESLHFCFSPRFQIFLRMLSGMLTGMLTGMLGTLGESLLNVRGIL